MLPFESTPICGPLAERAGLFERLRGCADAAPPSEDRLKNTEKWPGPLSSHTIVIFPRASTAICGACELPVAFEILTGGQKTTCACAVEDEIASAKIHRPDNASIRPLKR